MHKKRLVYLRVVLNPIQIYVQTQMVRSYLMQKIQRTGGKPTFSIF